MNIKTDSNGERFVLLPSNHIAYPCGGGYWHLCDSSGDLIYGWITAKKVRKFVKSLPTS